MRRSNETIARYALTAASILLGILALSHLLSSLPYAKTITAVIVIFYEVAVPVELVRILGMRARDLSMYAHNIDTLIDVIFPPYGVKKVRPDYGKIGEELRHVALVMAVTFIPYVLLYWGYHQMLALNQGTVLQFSFNLPPKLGYEIITQLFVIALPEELFYRGYLQGSLLKKWPNRVTLLGLPLGRAVIVTNLIFALGHVAATFAPIRMLTFFPGMIFSYLTYRNKSILGAIVYHAACNILGQILYASFFLG